MNWPDAVNGSYELLGGVLVLNHCRAVLRDKAVAGVSVLSTVMFTTWGAWNALLYYPGLGQRWSAIGAVFVLGANVSYTALLIRYRRRPVPQRKEFANGV